MDYHLVCVHPFGRYIKGQHITDPDEVAKLLDDREHNFVRIAIPAAPAPEPAAVAPPAPPAKPAASRE